MKKQFVAALLGISMLSLVGCGSSTEPLTQDNPVVVTDPQEPSTGVSDPVVSEPADNRIDSSVVDSINALGFQLYEKAVASTSDTENMLISPCSVSIAFSMLDNAADNSTKEQLEGVLGITDLDGWNSQIYKLLDEEKIIASADEDSTSAPKIITSNSFWMDDNLVLSGSSEDVIDTIKNYYNGDIFTEDFADKATADKVDKWIDDSTKGLIKGLGGDISNLESLLVNTIYFKGSWVSEFDEANTQDRDFRTNFGTTQVTSMQLTRENEYYINQDGLEAISLPYQSCCDDNDVEHGNFEMVIIKSADENDLTTDRFDSLSIEEKQAFLTALSEEESATQFKTIQVPRFEYEYTYDGVKNDLISLGMTNVFDSESADLSKLSAGLYVSDVKHKAVISVDESGTEAAAMTALMMDCAMAAPEELSTKEFIVDKPFTYVIRDVDTGLIYFIGAVNLL